jgi:hypothetical protein
MTDSNAEETPEAATDEFMSLTHIGWEWHVSNRVLGKALDEAGYRSFGSPTPQALKEGLAIQQTGGRYKWSQTLVSDFIEQQGLSEGSHPLKYHFVLSEPLVVR